MLIVYWPITIKFRTREQTSKPQTNYRCCLRFRYLTPYWLISRTTITFHKYFWCSRFCEFHSKCNEYKIYHYQLPLNHLFQSLWQLVWSVQLNAVHANQNKPSKFSFLTRTMGGDNTRKRNYVSWCWPVWLLKDSPEAPWWLCCLLQAALVFHYAAKSVIRNWFG